MRRLAPSALVTALAAAGEATRLRILQLLAHGEFAVGELAVALGQSQPRISRHLKLLTETGQVIRLPEGAWVFYRLAPEGTPERSMVDAVLALVDPTDPELVRDAARLEEIARARETAAQAYFAENAENWSELRSMHLPEADIEAALREAAGEGPFDYMVDVGVGQGRAIEVLLDRCRRAEGFDTSRQMLAIARATLAASGGKAQVRFGDIYDPPIPPATADLVTVYQVLHFLSDPRGAVIEAARMLRPGGRLVIVDFAPHEKEILRERHAHRRLGFSDEDVRDWCAAAGVPSLAIRKLVDRTRDSLTVALWAGDKVSADTVIDKEGK